jgi:methionyl-tRNA formyltransferase
VTVAGTSFTPHRLVYLGTPEMAVPPLEALVAAGFDVAAVVTRIDKRRGRGGSVTPSPVKAAAGRLGIPVFHRVDDVLDLGADLAVVVAFGQIIAPRVLEQLPMVNLHFSLLPRWRGAAPVERALLAGDEVTGVCVMQVAEGLDTGDVYARVEVPISDGETGDAVRAALVHRGSELLVTTLTEGLGQPVPQSGEATYATKITADDLRLDWAEPAIERHRVVRLGGAWTTFRGRRVKVVAADLLDPAATGGLVTDAVAGVVGGLRLCLVQPEGKAPMTWRDFANGARPSAGETFE